MISGQFFVSTLHEGFPRHIGCFNKMLTLKQDPENQQIGVIWDGKKKKPVYWHPRKNEALREDVDFNDWLESRKFRIKYKLTAAQQSQIIDHLVDDTAPEGSSLRNTFYTIRSDLENRLYTEINLTGSDSVFVPRWYPEDKKAWPGHQFVAGSSGAGKTGTMVWSYIKPNLDGPAKFRRRFLYLSAEANVDKTLKGLKKKKYADWIRFIDLSSESVEKHGVVDVKGDSETYWKEVVKPAIDGMQEGSCIIMDDFQDAAGDLPTRLRRWSNTALRTLRHKGVGVTLLMHSIKSAAFSSQAHNTVKTFILFPRTQKAKIQDWLVKDLGLSMKEARGIQDFADSGRWLFLNVHSPQFMCNEKIIRTF